MVLQTADTKTNHGFQKPAAQNVAALLAGHLIANSQNSVKLPLKICQFFIQFSCIDGSPTSLQQLLPSEILSLSLLATQVVQYILHPFSHTITVLLQADSCIPAQRECLPSGLVPYSLHSIPLRSRMQI